MSRVADARVWVDGGEGVVIVLASCRHCWSCVCGDGTRGFEAGFPVGVECKQEEHWAGGVGVRREGECSSLGTTSKGRLPRERTKHVRGL